MRAVQINQEEMTGMFTITEKAVTMIKVYLNYINVYLNYQHGTSAVRIVSMGSIMGMTLDHPTRNDVTFVERELTFVMDRDLFDRARPISVDYIESPDGFGFSLRSSLPIGRGGRSGCGGCLRQLGGHSVEDEEIKYGLSGTGFVHPGRIMFNEKAWPDGENPKQADYQAEYAN